MLRVRAAPAGLLEVGYIGADAVGTGVEEKGIEIRKPEPPDQKGGEQKEGTKTATAGPDHERSLGIGTDFVYLRPRSQCHISVHQPFSAEVRSWGP